MQPNHNQTILIRVLVERIEEASGAISMEVEAWETFVRMVLPEFFGDRPEDTKQTDTAPGSAEKIDKMAQRVAKGMNPFSEHDTILHHRHTAGRGLDYRLSGEIEYEDSGQD
jgi:hypothetical protein